MSDPQDVAEGFDEETIGSDPDVEGRMDSAVDRPYLANEPVVTEPIVDSVDSRERRLEADDDGALASALDEAEVDLMEVDLSDALIGDEAGVVNDDGDLSSEEAAMHIIEIE